MTKFIPLRYYKTGADIIRFVMLLVRFLLAFANVSRELNVRFGLVAAIRHAEPGCPLKTAGRSYLDMKC